MTSPSNAIGIEIILKLREAIDFTFHVSAQQWTNGWGNFIFNSNIITNLIISLRIEYGNGWLAGLLQVRQTDILLTERKSIQTYLS